MVITIDGIQKLKHNFLLDREIIDIKSQSHYGTEHYTFHFPKVEGHKPSKYSQWEDAFVIHLAREPKNGVYELFWMGLHGVTCQYLEKSDIKNFSKFYSHFRKVITLAKQYWDDNK